MLSEQDIEAVADVARQNANRHHELGTAPVEALAKAAEVGLLGMGIPAGLPGSQGMTPTQIMQATIRLAYGDPSFAMGFNMHTVAMGFLDHPSASAAREYIAALGARHLFSSLASEPKTRGDDLFSFIPGTRVERVADGYLLTGTKLFASNFEISRFAVVSAQPSWSGNDKGSVLLVVDTWSPGIRVDDIWRTPGLRSTRSNRVRFDKVLVPHNHLLLETDSFLRLFLLECGMPAFGRFAAVYLGGAKRLVDVFIEARGAGPLTEDCARRLQHAEDLLLAAAQLHEVQGPGQESVVALLRAKKEVGDAVDTVTHQLKRHANLRLLQGHSPHQWDGEFIRLWLDLLTVDVMPPSTQVCDYALTHGLPPL